MGTYADICKIDNGAAFVNADLHIHSFRGSSDVTDTSMTPLAIVESAIKQDLQVIAITDHNNDANVEETINSAKQYADRLLVIPGVEVTTTHGHLLVYFAPDKLDVLDKFLTKLDLNGKRGIEHTRTSKSMTDTIIEAERLGGISIAAHIDRAKTGFHMFAPGHQDWKQDIISCKGLYGVECDAVPNLIWYSEHDDNSPEGTERRKMFETRRKSMAARYHLAHLQGSDAHSMAMFHHTDPTKKWTRMKLSELSFDAFRVALTDCTARVRACGEIPRSIPRVRGLSTKGGFLNDEEIQFNDNLNCFIGGRGTGKSTAIRSIAYALGSNESFETLGSCPNEITVWCQGDDGTLFRYQRTRSGEIDAVAKSGSTCKEVPTDSFTIDYYGQGSLAEVAHDPLSTPELLQEFLDRHIMLRDLLETQSSILDQLRDNGSRLIPLEAADSQLEGHRKSLGEIHTKITLAEEGKLRDVVSLQNKLASERALREAIEGISSDYSTGYQLDDIKKSFEDVYANVGECTEDSNSKKTIASIRMEIEATNAAVDQKALELNQLLKQSATRLQVLTKELKANFQRLSLDVSAKLDVLKKQGITPDVSKLDALLRQKVAVTRKITVIEQQANELKNCRKQRNTLLSSLTEVRNEMSKRRKAQLESVNKSLRDTIQDYRVFVLYDDSGIITEFVSYLKDQLVGTYVREDTLENLCSRINPSSFANLVRHRDTKALVTECSVSEADATKIIDKLCFWNIIFDLQALDKPPKPTIKVTTVGKPGKPARDIDVIGLSDGQRHTILLTIAILAEANVPLIIDQPEDELDNAFIFASIVSTLRRVKGRRQVIVVTHNANIAVLGDSELILPMQRVDHSGRVKDRGSIDSTATKHAVESILEGGKDAFLQRKEIYGHR